MEDVRQIFTVQALNALNSEIEQVLIANGCTRENIDRFNIKNYQLENGIEKRAILKDNIVIYTVLLDYNLIK